MLAKKEDGGKVLLKMGFLVPKTLRMKILELRLFKKLESEKLFKERDLESYFQNQKEEIEGGTWPRVAMHRFPSTYHASPVYPFDGSNSTAMQCFLSAPI